MWIIEASDEEACEKARVLLRTAKIMFADDHWNMRLYPIATDLTPEMVGKLQQCACIVTSDNNRS
jgi:hypothetical protein